MSHIKEESAQHGNAERPKSPLHSVAKDNDSVTGIEDSSSPKFSSYNHLSATEPLGELTVLELVRVIHSDRHKDACEEIAKLKAEMLTHEEGSDSYKRCKEKHIEAKRRLPCTTPSGTFTRRTDASLIKHTGLAQLDVDGGDNDIPLNEIKEIIINDPHTHIAFLSPSKDGYKALVRLEVNEDGSNHKACYNSLIDHYKQAYGVEVDPSCKNVSRALYMSHDKGIFTRPLDKVDSFKPRGEEPKPAKQYQLSSRNTYSTARTADEEAKIALSYLDPDMSYPDWRAVGAGCHDKGVSFSVWDSWSSGGNKYDPAVCDDEWSRFKAGGGINFGTVIRMATDANGGVDPVNSKWDQTTATASDFEDITGEVSDTEIPEDVFPVPAGGIGNNTSAEIIFPVMGEMKRLFVRGSRVHEIVKGHESEYLAPLSPERFCSLVEDAGKRVARKEARQIKGVNYTIWRSTTFPVSAAKIMLETDASRKYLPPIRQIVNCPIMTADGEILTRGYHSHSGGTYIGAGSAPEDVLFGTAVRALLGILGDFEFAAKSDMSRAFASLISPALKMGGWINDEFPLDLAEATESQSGKTFRQKLVCRIYNEIPTSITLARGGVGSIDESISAALVKGRPFVTLANMRGKIDSTILEEALRGSGRVNCRTLRNSTEVDCQPFLWQFSTNGAELTRDLANRAIVTRIRKKPAGYEWKEYPEGDLERHVQANQSLYLGCVFAVLSKWDSQGRPTTDESRHDFRGWCRALDGIVQMCGLEPLLDGHKEQQERTANPQLQWLRQIILAVKPEQYGEELFIYDLVDIAEECGIEFQGAPFSRDDSNIRAGRILGKIFRDAECDNIEVDGFSFSRIEEPDYSESGKGRLTKKYTIKPL